MDGGFRIWWLESPPTGLLDGSLTGRMGWWWRLWFQYKTPPVDVTVATEVVGGQQQTERL